MEIIRFVLSNFWVWLGAVILILAIGQEAVEIIKAVHPSRKISAYKIGDRWRMEIDGARRGDIQSKYLSPLEDVMAVVQLYERVTPDGISYIVAKTGLLIAAVIFPYKVVNETFVTRLEEVTRECRRVLDAPPARTLERDTEQGNMFQE